MLRFGLKDMLRGMTLAAIGFGMLAIAFDGSFQTQSTDPSTGDAVLVAFGGMLVGYGFAFPIKWPPYQMVFGMIGTFAAQAWQSGNSFGLLFYVALMGSFGLCRAVLNLRAKRENITPSARPGNVEGN
jgi:hypothetical protein